MTRPRPHPLTRRAVPLRRPHLELLEDRTLLDGSLPGTLIGPVLPSLVGIASHGGNHAPDLQPIADQKVLSMQQTVSVPLSASDPEGDPITFTASAQSLAWVLRQQHGQFVYHPEYDNYYGQSEQWFLAAQQWYFLRPSGELVRWDGSNAASGTSLGLIGASYYEEPLQLQNAAANDAHVSVSVTGSTLSITRDTAWVSAAVITVTASDGKGGTDTESFTLVVTQPLTLRPIANQTVPSSQEAVSVPLSASDPEGDPITFTASAQSLAWVLRQQHGQFVYHSQYDNWGGQNERWFLASGQWYFLLGSGELFRWDSSGGASGTSLGLVGSSYYQDPLRLQNAAANDAHVSVAVSGGKLSITRDTAWVNAVVITVTASDDTGDSDTKTFTLFVERTPPPLPTVTIEATDAEAGEANNPGTFTITRTGPTTAALTVTFTVGGTATNGADYASVGTSVTIPAGASSTTVTVSPINDTLVEPSETVVLTLSGSGAYEVGALSDATVTITDNDSAPPVLQPIANQKVLSMQQTVSVPLSASDPEGDPISFTASAQSLAWVLRQQHGQLVYHPEYNNYYGQNELWFLASGQWYFLRPSGELVRWNGSNGASGTSLGLVGASYYEEPLQLQNAAANDAHVSVSVTGNTLSITRDPAWVSAVVITVTASDGIGCTDTESFTLVVTQPLTLRSIANQTVPSSQEAISVPLSASDPEGDPITFTASAQSLAWVLRQQHGQFVYHPAFDNWGGQNERWFLASGQWYFLLASGELFRWSGSGMSGTSVGSIGASYYQDPLRLQNAAANDAHVSLSVTGGKLSITRDLAWVSAVVITVTASDGKGDSDSKSFTLLVTG